MKKRFIILILLVTIHSLYSERLTLKKIVKCEEEKLFRFLDNDLMFYRTIDAGLFYYDNINNKICFFYYPEEKKYQLIQLDRNNRLIVGISNDKPDFSDLTKLNYYFIYLKDNSSIRIYNTSKCISEMRENNKSIPEILHKIYYDRSYAYAKINNYYLIASDVLNHGIKINAEAPEKHAYHDMDLCLIDGQGNICAVLPFTVDDQTAMKKNILESSPDGKTLKIKASGSYFFARINDTLLDKYPEFKDGLYYFIYEISNEQTVKDIEYIDLSSELNLEEGKSIDVKYEKKNYSGFDVKINEVSINNTPMEQKKAKSFWWDE